MESLIHYRTVNVVSCHTGTVLQWRTLIAIMLSLWFHLPFQLCYWTILPYEQLLQNVKVREYFHCDGFASKAKIIKFYGSDDLRSLRSFLFHASWVCLTKSFLWFRQSKCSSISIFKHSLHHHHQPCSLNVNQLRLPKFKGRVKISVELLDPDPSWKCPCAFLHCHKTTLHLWLSDYSCANVQFFSHALQYLGLLLKLIHSGKSPL